ncbi:glycoside hydrolase family 9 protein [Marinoscillum furvescens]|uniref:Endoglucanase n=1 Tax=Marinoscillum furvescens DSM 4134 TaxID=1122208 RepID=A0A3D9L3F2_MARFU|nr:glycoside hydrolase family 9 protein [Marinoscillum furvescens]RED99583.1 non-processive endocellulase [Marinoscillum furvescens DSM 4134]
MHKFRLYFFISVTLLAAAHGQNGTEAIRLNQIGYYPNTEKLAVVVEGKLGTGFNVRNVSDQESAFSGELTDYGYWESSGESVTIADFSSLTTPGEYFLDIPDIGKSYPFVINDHVLNGATKAAFRAYYFNRASMAIDPGFGDHWHRAAGHPDDHVLVHSSAASSARPEGTSISSPGGWYDAGDFGKYIVNGGISVHTLLAAYEAFPQYYDQLQLRIPESSNNLPDLLDEVRYELDWMLTMQDEDGGVYHKLTTLNFVGEVMPATSNAQRYVYYKSTAAALNFAAALAQGARIYEPFDSTYATQLLAAAKKAWTWALNHPDRIYDQNKVNQQYDPDVYTGAYGDGNVADEFNWAGIELYLTTQNDTYLESVDFNHWLGAPSWPGTHFLGLASILNNPDRLTDAVSFSSIKDKVLALANDLEKRRANAPYKISHDSFYWGSNSNAGNDGMVLLYAYLHTKESKYLNAAISIVDYLLGRNATGYSFLTGVGSKRVMNIHHRQSMADNISDPVPGFIAGGPDGQWSNYSGYCTGTDFGNLPAKAFLDIDCAYSMTEVTINWNAPFVFLAGGLEAMASESDFTAANKLAIPTLLESTTVTDTEISLIWKDNAFVEEYYIIERSSGGNSAFEEVAKLAANTTSYTDEGLLPGTNYTYRVKASYKDWESDYATIEATTLEVGALLHANSYSKLFPTKTTGELFLKHDQTPQRIIIRSLSGTVLSVQSVSIAPNLTRINVHNLADGVYLIQAEYPGYTETQRIIKL